MTARHKKKKASSSAQGRIAYSRDLIPKSLVDDWSIFTDHAKKKREKSRPKECTDSIPRSVSPFPPRCNGTLHQVQPGDTLHNLAKAKGMTLEAILTANPQITDPNSLNVGQVICIPIGSESLSTIINTLLTAERLEVAMYARGLMSPALEALPPEERAYFQAGLSHEMAHVNYLESIGASSPYTQFFFPPGTFEDQDLFVSTLLMIETAGVSAYIQASSEFCRMGRLDLSRIADQIMGVEAEHRTLLRDVLGLVPANNLCFENAPDEPVTVILSALPNFLQPNQFDGASEGPIPLPSPETVEELVGPNGCPNPTP